MWAPMRKDPLDGDPPSGRCVHGLAPDGVVVERDVRAGKGRGRSPPPLKNVHTNVHVSVH